MHQNQVSEIIGMTLARKMSDLFKLNVKPLLEDTMAACDRWSQLPITLAGINQNEQAS